MEHIKFHTIFKSHGKIPEVFLRGCGVREYFIPDFSNWKDHDSYQTAFQRLVKDLKAEASR